MRRPVFLLLAISFFLTGCSRSGLWLAERHEKKGRTEQALKAYVRVAEEYPGSGAAPRALFQAGRLASRSLKDYSLARDLFHRVVDQYGDRKDWGARAEAALFKTPDYFPLTAEAQWEYAGPETGGKVLRIRVTCRPSDKNPLEMLLVHTRFDGKEFSRDSSATFRYWNQSGELREAAEEKTVYKTILKYPFDPGARWTVREGDQDWSFIIDGFATADVRAGIFKDCLKVRRTQSGTEKLHYYAPGVGEVLRTASQDGRETPELELISYDLPEGSVYRR